MARRSQNEEQKEAQEAANEAAQEVQAEGLAAREETSEAQAEAGAEAPDAGPAPTNISSDGDPVAGNEEPLDSGGDGRGLEPANPTGFGENAEFTPRDRR